MDHARPLPTSTRIAKETPKRCILKRRPPFSLEAIPYPLRRVICAPEDLPAWKQPAETRPAPPQLRTETMVPLKPEPPRPPIQTADSFMPPLLRQEDDTVTTSTMKEMADQLFGNKRRPSLQVTPPPPPSEGHQTSPSTAYQEDTPSRKNLKETPTTLFQRLAAPHAEALLKKAVQMAMNGDALVMQTLLHHLLSQKSANHTPHGHD